MPRTLASALALWTPHAVACRAVIACLGTPIGFDLAGQALAGLKEDGLVERQGSAWRWVADEWESDLAPSMPGMLGKGWIGWADAELALARALGVGRAPAKQPLQNMLFLLAGAEDADGPAAAFPLELCRTSPDKVRWRGVKAVRRKTWSRGV